MIFENSFSELVDVLIEKDNSLSFTSSDYTKVGEFLAQDVFDILIEEKTGLKDYDSIKIIRIIEKLSSMTWNSSVYKEKYHQVHISCTYKGIAVSGSEMIEDLPQKLREIKLEKILND